MPAEGDSRRRSVLVVEDEALLLFTIADDLRAAGFQVLEATNAVVGLRLAEAAGGIDVLFTDVHMPGPIDGLALARAVRSKWPGTHIVVTSGHVTASVSDLPPGAVFLPKPYLPDAVIAAMG